MVNILLIQEIVVDLMIRKLILNFYEEQRQESSVIDNDKKTI